jgi:hypothetical protein
MIYILERSFSRQLAALQASGLSGAVNSVLWLYPECSRPTICGLPVFKNRPELQPVTTYGESAASGRRTLAQPFDAVFVSRLLAQKAKVTRRCDSIALYSPGSSEWLACAIPHEGMVLLKAPASLSALHRAGFSASETAPSWW